MKLLRPLVLLILAAGIAWGILEPFNDWIFRWEMLEYIVPNMLHPRSGFFSLLLVVFLCLWLPTRPVTGHQKRSSAPRPEAPRQGPSSVVEIPSVDVVALEDDTRREVAAALGIGWTTKLGRDDKAWKTSYEDALRRAGD